jgi:LAO/AO transport system kinase
MSGRLDSPEAYADAIRAGDRRAVARTITLLESTRADHKERGQAILEQVVPHTGTGVRVGITGPPGVGKSTFIEGLGLHLVDQGHRVAVLAVDPSSPITGGSILGDKTRMISLAQSPSTFIRPSPSGGSLGGVAHRTRESMLICEAAGYDVVLVETVGIGQSEVAVAGMVDFFLVLLLPGGGDELQGIKKGVMELADALVVNKADGDSEPLAQRTASEYRNALDLIRPSSTGWKPCVLMASSLAKVGIDRVWETIQEHRTCFEASGALAAKRRDQARVWMWTLLGEELQSAFRGHPGVAARVPELEQEVAASKRTPASAARVLLEIFGRS